MTVELTPEGIGQFWDQGFLCIPEIAPLEEIEWMRGVYDRLFARQAGWQEGNFFDFAGPETPGSALVLPQLLEPSRYEPCLKDTAFRRNALAVAKQLLGPSAKQVFEHAMLKPPVIGAETPWHQDEAFYRKYMNYETITIWMPLQPVDLTNGCMQFIAGSHKQEVLPHRRINDDPRIHGLEVHGVDLTQPVSCPLSAGGATVHHCRTLHHAGPNLSGMPRRAYALGFGIRSKQYMVHSEFPWNVVGEAPRNKRAYEAQTTVERWLNRLRTTARALLR